MGFPFLTAFLIFVVWLALRYHKLYQIQKEREDDFWNKERIANSTPAKDIANLSYLTIPLEKFPINFTNNKEVTQLEDELKDLSTHRLLNLTGKTNTELKTEYGVPNFETMCQIGEDFDRLTVLLNAYAKAIIQEDHPELAIPVLEYAVGIKTDVAESYTLLASCYKAQSLGAKLEYLRQQVESSNLVLKKSILEHI